MNHNRIKLPFSIFLFFNVTFLFGQVQIGGDIDGEAGNDRSGYSVSMSDDRNIAIGAIYNDGTASNAGHVRVYHWDGSSWTQTGNDINGEASHDNSGISVSMPDSAVVGIGAYRNDGNGGNSGHVRIYRWNGTAWIQKGLDIDGEAIGDESGKAISMPDSNTVAIGAANNGGNGTNAGHVRIYKWNGSAWIQKGLDIDGTAADYNFGWSVNMPDSNTVAIGAKGDLFEMGEVQIYKWNGTTWVQKGSTIVGEAAFDLSGISVSMPDTNTVAIGAANNAGNGSQAGHVRIYKWNGSDWSQKGTDIDGEAADDRSGASISMADSNTIAIGANWNDGNGSFAGHVRIYKWNGLSWQQHGMDIDGEAADDQSGFSVHMPTVNTVAIGAYFNGGNGFGSGHARVYSLCEDNVVDVQTACGTYTWIDGNTYTSSTNTPTWTLTNVNGCDSVITLDLTINNANTGTDVQAACGSYTWIDGNTYTSSTNTPTWTLTNVNGCDSVVTLDLTINTANTGTDVQTACDTYTWIDGNTYTSSTNTPTWTLTNVNGCDSVVTLDLTINYSNTGTDVQTACDTYTWIDGNIYTSSTNTPTWILTNVNGCDSVVTLDLTINYSNTGTDVQTACDTYTWIDGNTYTSSTNTPTWTLTNVNGCDSVVTLDLTINYSNTGTDVQMACGTYTWIDGNTYTSSTNTPTWTLTNVNGCDSVVTLDLTINTANTGTDVQTACDTYTWIDGNTYTSSTNTPTWTLTNVNGCDSVVTLDLTINTANTGTDVQMACDTYTWIDGNTYTSSTNTPTWTLTNVNGCDSVVTLDLTINYSNTGTDVQTACDTYTWIDGNTYTSSTNTPTWTLTNVSGCDSVVTLDLTINYSNTGTDVQAACGSYTWIDGNTYTTSTNTPTWTLTNVSGCDSVVTLDLTINYPNTGTDVQAACGSYTWIDGNTYTSSTNTPTWTLTNISGCDSIVTLDLTINALPDSTVSVSGFTITADESGVTYQWIDCDNNGAPISGETNQSFTPTENGNYAVILDNGNCTSTSECESITGLGVEPNEYNTFKVYPNPNLGEFFIELEQYSQPTKLTVFNVVGEKVLTQLVSSQKTRVELNLRSGVYFVMLEGHIKRIVIK